MCMKVGFPSTNDCPASEFSRMDFDTDEEFFVFYTSKFCWCVYHMQLKLPLFWHGSLTLYCIEVTRVCISGWSLPSTHTPNYIKIGKAFCGRKYGRMDTFDEFSKSIRTSLGDDLKLIMAAHSNGQAIIFLPCGFFYLLLLLSFFACLISAVADWMSAILLHMVWP